MRMNTRQKIKLTVGLLMTFYILLGVPGLGLDPTIGSKAAWIAGVWLAVGAAVWYRRDRF